MLQHNSFFVSFNLLQRGKVTCVVNKGASLAVVAVMLGAVKLLTKFGFVVLRNGLSLGELLLSVGKSALKKG